MANKSSEIYSIYCKPLIFSVLCPKYVCVLLIWRLADRYNVARYVQRILASF